VQRLTKGAGRSGNGRIEKLAWEENKGDKTSGLSEARETRCSKLRQRTSRQTERKKITGRSARTQLLRGKECHRVGSRRALTKGAREGEE